MRTAIIAGATGLVGKQLLDLLLADEGFDRVISISRKPPSISHPKLIAVITPLEAMANHASSLTGDDVFCCLGTTIKQAGSEAAFRKVDFEYPIQLGTITKGQGAKRLFIVTALGSNKNSSIFYNRVKGEVEEAVGKLGFEALHIFQPSLLLGDRQGSRAGETIGKHVMSFFGLLIPRKYKAIESSAVAKAMLAAAHSGAKGTVVHSSAEMQIFSK